MGFKKVVWLGLALVLFSNFVLGEIMINEVMYAPVDGNEWIEIYNDGNESINLENWNLTDNLATDKLVCCGFVGNCSLMLEGYGYAIITDQDTSLYNNLDTTALKICVDDNSIGNGLGNTGDSIRIYNNSYETPLFEYNKNMGGYNNNKTLEKNKKGEWKESIVPGGTPGRKNSVYDFSYDFSVLEITEVMADPFGEDEALKPLGEWVEIYNSGTEPVYLEGLVLYDSEDDDELYVTDTNTNSLELCGGCYGVIYRNGDGDFDLSKIEDKVRLFTGYPVSENILIDEVSFSNSMEGMSWSKFEDGWYLTVPTPGEENAYTGGCDWEVKVEMDNAIFQGDDLDFNIIVKRNYGFENNITVRGKIEDIFGELVKEYKPWTDVAVETERTKSYSPNLGEGVYQISFWLEELNCDDQEPSNNEVTKLVAINPKYKETESSLNIEKLYLGSDESAEWGDQFTVKVNVYKGEETRYSVQLWAEKSGEKVSKTTKLNIYDAYKNYTLTLPVQLDPNCNNKIDDGKATLVLEAFGLRKEERFSVEEVDKDICKDYLDYVKDLEKESETENAYQIIELPTSIHKGEVLKVKVQLIGDKEEHNFKVWSYLYRGSKCYSCCDGCDKEREREDNMINFKLGKNEVKQVELLVKVDDELEEGEYKLKVKLNKDGQKTNKELTESMFVEAGKEVNSSLCLLGGVEEEKAEEKQNTISVKLNEGKKKIIDEVKGVVVYESSSTKAEKLIPYLLIGIFGLLSLILIWKRI